MNTPFEDYLQHLADSFNYRPEYGRGMYGKECFAVECSMKELFEETLSYIKHNVNSYQSLDFTKIQDFIETAIEEDSMGKGSIVYFPKCEPIEVEE